MKSRHSLARLAAMLTLAASTGFSADEVPLTKPHPSIPLASRFKATRERIDALYRHRNETPPPPDPRHNPFREAGSLIVAARGEGGGDVKLSPIAPTSKLALVQQCVATLKVSGVFEVGGRMYCVINGRPYKPGTLVQTRVEDETVFLRVHNIVGRVVTLALDDAEVTLKF